MIAHPYPAPSKKQLRKKAIKKLAKKIYIHHCLKLSRHDSFRLAEEFYKKDKDEKK